MRDVQLLPERPAGIPILPGRTAAQKAGLRYERKFFSWLGQNIPPGWQLRRSVWFSYYHYKQHYAELDGLLLHPERAKAVILEAKIRNTRRVVEQLERYSELVAAIWPLHDIKSVEVCQYFDPAELNWPLTDSLFTPRERNSAFLWNPNLY